jgi:hypothetical protein
MAIRYSDAATALQAGETGLRQALSNANITFFTGTQPTSANDSYGSSQPIINFTLADGVLTNETKTVWETTLSGLTGTAGFSSIKVGGFEILGATITSTTLPLILTAVCNQINDYQGNLGFSATNDGATKIQVIAPKGTGANYSGVAIAYTTSGTITATGTAITTAGVAAVNGLTFNPPSNNTIDVTYDLSKPASETWSGSNGYGPATAVATAAFGGIVNGTTYTAGWGRILCSASDDGSTATSGATGYIRVDFSIGTSGTDFIMSPAATFTVNTTTPVVTSINSFTLQVAKNLA